HENKTSAFHMQMILFPGYGSQEARSRGSQNGGAVGVGVEEAADFWQVGGQILGISVSGPGLETAMEFRRHSCGMLLVSHHTGVAGTPSSSITSIASSSGIGVSIVSCSTG